jgi:RNA polymerase sigma factor (sigma-70 family)
MTTMHNYDQMSDGELLLAWKANNQRAGAALLARHHTSIARFFAHRIDDDTDDLVQQTFLGLLEGIDRFREDASFRTYLFAIARNQLLSAIAKRVRDRNRFDPGVTSIADLGPSPSTLDERRAQNKLLLAALQRLPIDVQIMLELHFWENMMIKDIAEVLNMNPSTVRVRMMRGRAKLYEEMEALAESKDALRTTLDGLSKWAARLRAEIGDAADDGN